MLKIKRAASEVACAKNNEKLTHIDRNRDPGSLRIQSGGGAAVTVVEDVVGIELERLSWSRVRVVEKHSGSDDVGDVGLGTNCNTEGAMSRKTLGGRACQLQPGLCNSSIAERSSADLTDMERRGSSTPGNMNALLEMSSQDKREYTCGVGHTFQRTGYNVMWAAC